MDGRSEAMVARKGIHRRGQDLFRQEGQTDMDMIYFARPGRTYRYGHELFRQEGQTDMDMSYFARPEGHTDMDMSYFARPEGHTDMDMSYLAMKDTQIFTSLNQPISFKK